VKKPSILLILILCLVLLPVNVFATTTSTYEDYAENLSKLGVFVGTGDGFELDRAPTRIEGLVMLIRLLGSEAEADKMKGISLPFTDVPKWASGYAAYAYENGLTNGISSTKFGSSNKLEAKAFLTFLLRSLGYNDQSGDFSYKNSLTFSKGIGLINDTMYSTLNNSEFLRAYIAKTSYDALKFPYKGGETILIDKLMAENKIDKVIGNEFKIVELTEPAPLSIKKTGAIPMEENLKSVVMLQCCGEDSDYYEEDSEYYDEPGGYYGGCVGSGVILSSDGKIVTNYHVIQDVSDIQVTFYDGTVYDGKVYIEDYDEDQDLAVIKIDKTGLTPATLGDSNDVKAGEKVITIGSPYGYLNTVSEGIVSAVRSDCIQISAPINPGNSGGGLFDEDGKLIGIPSSMLYIAQNMGFAIPVNQLTEVSENRNLPLEKFYVMNTGPLPSAPTGLKVMYETSTTALLNWNFGDAEGYSIYCKEEGDDDYYYLGEAVYGAYYGYLAEELTPGKLYSFKVSAEKGGRESDLSSEVTFKKSSGNLNHSSSNFFYTDYPEIPDFGKLSGLSPYKKETNKFYYDISDIDYVVELDYTSLLEDFGYLFDSSTTKSDGSVTEVYINDELNQSVIVTEVETDDSDNISVTIVSE